MSQRYIYRSMNTWDEKNYIEQKTNCLNNSDNAPSGSTNEIRSGSTMNAWNATGSLNQMHKLCYNGETGEYVGENQSHVVYLWTETRDGVEYPCYVGQTTWKIHKRLKDHLIYDNPFLFQRKLRKHPNIYKCYTIAEEKDRNLLDELETAYILEHNTFHDYNKNGYNLLIGTKHHITSDLVRNKISNKLRGKKHPFYGKTLPRKHVDRIIKSKKGWFERLTFEEQENFRKNASKAHTGKKHSKEWCRNMSLSQKGRTFSEEHKEKLRLAKIGKSQSSKHIEKRMRKMRGRKLPKYLKKQISKKLMGHTNNSSTGICGVSKHLGKYLANGPMINGKRKYLGIYKTVSEAKLVIEKYKNEHRI